MNTSNATDAGGLDRLQADLDGMGEMNQKNQALQERALKIISEISDKTALKAALQENGMANLDIERFLAARTIAERAECIFAMMRLDQGLKPGQPWLKR